MSITLELDSKTKPLCYTTGAQEVVVGREQIGILDFLYLAHYVLTNTDLEPDDPRRQFVKCVQAMHEDEGWNGKESVGLRSPVSAIPELVALCDADEETMRAGQADDAEIAVHLEMHREGRCPRANDEMHSEYERRVTARRSG